MDEPIWVERDLADTIHLEQLKEHGGRWGVRDENMLESALARPQQRWSDETDLDLFDLAAAYAFGIAKNHPFVDGNKRTAFMTLFTFLLVNGQRLHAPQAEAVVTMLGVADGSVSEADLAAWCRGHSAPAG